MLRFPVHEDILCLCLFRPSLIFFHQCCVVYSIQSLDVFVKHTPKHFFLSFSFFSDCKFLGIVLLILLFTCSLLIYKDIIDFFYICLVC